MGRPARRRIACRPRRADRVARGAALLAENNRLAYFPEMARSFAKMMSAHRKEVLFTVTTATELSPQRAKELDAVLRGFVAQGEVPVVRHKVEPSILGGVVVDIGEDRYIDMSVATKIKKISALLMEPL